MYQLLSKHSPESRLNGMIYKSVKISVLRCNKNQLALQLLSCLALLVCLAMLHLPVALSQGLESTFGVHPDRISYYSPQNNQAFKCLDGSQSIPLQSVNDNYCDCMDSSDEPGTSACPHGQFFCHNQGYLPRLIPSAWVNDGQCDCCDGSDEYNSRKCENNCDVLGENYRREQQLSREISDRGANIRLQYKEEARVRREQNQQLLEQYKRELSEKELAIKKLEEEVNSDFGPSHVFLPLKGKSYAFKDREYVYTLYPFERATQESTTGMQTELGRWAGWAGPAGNNYAKQKYEGGIQCWNGPTRSATINVACGVEDKIVSVTEPAKCEYVFDFITPAACPELEPEPVPPEETNQNEESQVTENSAPSLEVEDPEQTSEVGQIESPEEEDGNEERHDEL